MSALSPSAGAARRTLLSSLLRDVSRSFYLTLRILPSAVREQIGVAYLLARATDTIADTDALPPSERLFALRNLRQRILDERAEFLDPSRLAGSQSSPGERLLLQRLDEALSLLQSFVPADRQLIQKVLQTISGGQELDLIRFGEANAQNIVALNSDAELDDYTYRVAGCVGEFWTRICMAHLSPPPRRDLQTMVTDGIRFGKGLQLVNILRDLPSDLRQGRCYLPWPALQLVGLRPGDLLDPAQEPRLRPVYDESLRMAQDHLAAGWQYVLNLPRSWWRVRLASAWPVLIGGKTLEMLKTGPVLNADTRIKVSRAEVKAIIWKSILQYPFERSWERLWTSSHSGPDTPNIRAKQPFGTL